MRCSICKRMARNTIRHNICSRCWNRTLGTLIRTKVIDPEIFIEVISVNKKVLENSPKP